MKALVKHSAVVTGSVLLFGEAGQALGRSAERLEYPGVTFALGKQAFELMGHASGSYLGIIVGATSIAAFALRNNQES